MGKARARTGLGGAVLAALCLAGAAHGESKRQTPYWVSLATDAAILRAGPGKGFPAAWRYVREGLPLRVIQVRAEWRRVEDMGGTQGWMRASLLSEQRTAIITGEVTPLRAGPDRAAKVNWRAEPGVVGRISHCSGGWCQFDVKGRGGYVEQARIWGTDPGEAVD